MLKEKLLEDLKTKYNISYNLYDLAISYQNARIDNTVADIKFHTNWSFNNNCSISFQLSALFIPCFFNFFSLIFLF